MASTGTQAHALVDSANDRYAIKGAAMVSYAGPGITVEKRMKDGRVVGFMRPGPCDYIGHVGPDPVRFDLKSSNRRPGLDLTATKNRSVKRQLGELWRCWQQRESCPGGRFGILARRVKVPNGTLPL